MLPHDAAVTQLGRAHELSLPSYCWMDKENATEEHASSRWIEPQLSKLAVQAPTGPEWAQEIKFDGYRMAARIEKGHVNLLTRSGLDWTEKYRMTAAAFAQLKVGTAYIDGELCGVRPDGVTSFEIMQQVSDSGGGHVTYFAFDLVHLDGEDVGLLPLVERKARLAALLKKPPAGITYSDHEGGDGEALPPTSASIRR
jgi:ATP-dependent DNA ligase